MAMRAISWRALHFRINAVVVLVLFDGRDGVGRKVKDVCIYYQSCAKSPVLQVGDG